MAFITGKTVQGNCGPVTYRDGRYHCFPIPDVPGTDMAAVQQLLFYARIEGAAGEVVPIALQWPRFDEEKAGPRKYKTKTFFHRAQQCLFWSTDRLHWHRIENLTADEETFTISFDVTLTAPVCYVAVNLYYTRQMYKALKQDMAGSPVVEEKIIGRSWDGQDLTLFTATDFSVPEENKTHIHLQAMQHCCEFSGGFVLDALLRYLASGKAAELLKKYVFHVIPVVCVGDWSQGYMDNTGENPQWGPGFDPNMDWETFYYPETRAIRDYLDSLPQKPALLLDLHNARSNFIIMKHWLPPENVAQQERFCALVAQHCDYFPLEKAKRVTAPTYHDFVAYANGHYGLSLCLEFDRASIYDRAKGEPVPLEQAHYTRLAPQLLKAMDLFLGE